MKLRFFITLVIIGLLLFASVGLTVAQNRYTPIREGDKMPSIPFTFLESSDLAKRKIDFTGKITVFDIWTTWCGGCILGLPKMHELQRNYGNDLQIFLVNDGESRSKVERFITKRSNIPGLKISLPVVMGDSLLTKVVLEHFALPTYLVFGKDGQLMSKISDGDQTSKFVQAILEGRSTKEIDRNHSPLSPRALWNSELASGNDNGLTNIMFTSAGGSQISCHRRSVIDLYRFAYGSFYAGSVRERSFVESFPFNRVVNESMRPTNLGRSYYNKVQSDSMYSYKMTGPQYVSWAKMSNAMIHDIDNWFELESRIEKRIVKYVSVTIPDTTVFSKVNGASSSKVTDADLCLNNITIQRFLSNWNANMEVGRYFMSRYPIVNESGYKGRIGGICIEGVDTNNPEEVDKAISKFGIRFQLVERPIDMLVIRDRKMYE